MAVQQGLAEIMSRFDIPGVGPPARVPKALPLEVEVQWNSQRWGSHPWEIPELNRCFIIYVLMIFNEKFIFKWRSFPASHV